MIVCLPLSSCYKFPSKDNMPVKGKATYCYTKT